ncbi:MAG TPA: tRNA (adenosine(37)-N6)-threonylcarbamoyltransferase complex dimerization subunit type 1 TsaB [Xanthobacteraceae bacterium]|nr:tRNA (adenosine(37)-N6)-threonylcarbamoyltransferase complex dimerization subunit type 1 TsaB [Xanthobacteraceae bacterium]
MRILAIDTALAVCAAAVLDTEQPARGVRESLPMERGHAEALMPLIGRVMERANIEFAGLDRLAVTTGPGSFTGLRVGISAARAIALAAAKPAIGLSTLSCYAAPYIAQDDSTPVAVAIDARHEQVYLQVFGTAGRTLVSPRIASIKESVRTVPWGPVRIVGSSAKALAAAWPAGQPAPALIEQRPAPDIDWVARLGAAAQDIYASPKPLYLRAPDAQPQDASRLPRR